jgi:hypothetical protein
MNRGTTPPPSTHVFSPRIAVRGRFGCYGIPNAVRPAADPPLARLAANLVAGLDLFSRSARHETGAGNGGGDVENYAKGIPGNLQSFLSGYCGSDRGGENGLPYLKPFRGALGRVSYVTDRGETRRIMIRRKTDR